MVHDLRKDVKVERVDVDLQKQKIPRHPESFERAHDCAHVHISVGHADAAAHVIIAKLKPATRPVELVTHVLRGHWVAFKTDHAQA